MSNDVALTLQVDIGSRTVYLTAREAARELGVTEEWIRRRCSAAQPLAAVEDGNR